MLHTNANKNENNKCPACWRKILPLTSLEPRTRHMRAVHFTSTPLRPIYLDVIDKATQGCIVSIRQITSQKCTLPWTIMSNKHWQKLFFCCVFANGPVMCCFLFRGKSGKCRFQQWKTWYSNANILLYSTHLSSHISFNIEMCLYKLCPDT